jgi:integrase
VIATGTSTHPAFSIRWYEGRTRRKRSGFKSRTDAVEGLARVRTGLSDGTLIEKRRASIGFDDVGDSWLKLHSKPSLRSHDLNELNYRAHVKPYFKDTPLVAVTPERILRFRARLQAKTRAAGKDEDGKAQRVRLSPATVNVVLALVRSILKYAVACGHIPASPTDRVGRGKLMLPVEKPKLAPPVEKPEDVGRLLAAIRQIGEETNRPGTYPIFAFLAYTGARKGEALGLRWSDVDTKGHLVTIRHSYNGTTKSGRHRTVPIPPELVQILQEHKLADPWKGGPQLLVFPNDSGEMWSKNARLRDVLWLACDRCKLPRIRVHDLRHTYAAFYLMSGGNLYDLQKNLGHHSVAFTAEVYGHLSADHRIREAARVSYPVPPEETKVMRLKIR